MQDHKYTDIPLAMARSTSERVCPNLKVGAVVIKKGEVIRLSAQLTGVNTIIRDNPHSTTRLPRGGKNPIRVVLDMHLRTSSVENII